MHISIPNLTAVLTLVTTSLPTTTALTSFEPGTDVAQVPDGSVLAVGFMTHVVTYKNEFIRITDTSRWRVKNTNGVDTGFIDGWDKGGKTSRCDLKKAVFQTIPDTHRKGPLEYDCNILRNWAKDTGFVFKVDTKFIREMVEIDNSAYLVLVRANDCGFAVSNWGSMDELGDEPLEFGNKDVKSILDKGLDDYVHVGVVEMKGRVECKDDGGKRTREFKIVNCYGML